MTCVKHFPWGLGADTSWIPITIIASDGGHWSSWLTTPFPFGDDPQRDGDVPGPWAPA